MTAGPVDQLADALATAERLVREIGDDRWAAPTPCTEWTVRALLNHLVIGNDLFAEVLEGSPMVLDEVRHRFATDRLGGAPAEAFRESADRLLSAFRRPGVLDEPVTVPFGTVPGIVALHLRLTEILVHGWDLATAIGGEVRFPDDVVLAELAFSEQKLADLPPGRTPFAPRRPAPEDAPPLDRLAACLGRSVS